jgi:hypothetical protein
MLHFYEDTKVYVYAPAGIVTGGSELLHQLVDLINRNGRKAYIVYCGEKKHEIPSEYLGYFINLAETIEDKPHNLIIVYEGMFNKTLEIEKAQILLWWLSVDLMYHSSIYFMSLRDIFNFSFLLGVKSLALRLRKLIVKKENYFKNNISFKKLQSKNLTNGYQSVYAQNYMYKKGFDQIIPLSDYINTDFIEKINKIEEKEDIILYNPKKGIKFTKKIINANPDLLFIPIQNMTRKEVINLMVKAKVYIDFGFHPGKDRIPREAALLGCVVLTDKRGSAYYYEDVSIPSQYKFIDKTREIPNIGKKIRYILNNYEIALKDQEYYIHKIKKEKSIFEHEVKELLKL